MSLDTDGRLSGIAVPVDALSDELSLSITARDDQDASVSFSVTVVASNPDSDGDGLSDYLEQLIGTNSLLADSDGDGLGDSVEYLIGINLTDTNLLYVTDTGDDLQTGDSPATALATLDEASARLLMLPPEQSAVVLIERDRSVAGVLELSGQQRAVIGSVDFTTLQTMAPDQLVPSTILSSGSQRTLVINGCQSCSAYNVRITGGSGIQIVNSDVTLQRLLVIGGRAFDGGALWAQQSEITASGLHLAFNKARRGGAIALDESSVLSINDSTITGNQAQQEGGAIVVRDSVLNASNLVFSANTAPVAPVLDVFAGSADLANITAANNLIKALDSELLFRCRNAFLGSCPDAESIVLRDSVVANNRNASGQTTDLEGIRSVGAGNFVEPDRASPDAMGLTSSSPFGVSYFSDDPLLFNAGSRSALDANLERYFSRSGSVFTDSAQVEPGVHSARPIVRISDYTAFARVSDDAPPFGLQSIDIEFSQNGQVIKGLHRASVVVSSENPRAVAIGTGTIPDDHLNPVPAVSLGDGRYRIWLTSDFIVGRDGLYLRLDDDTVGVDVVPVVGLVTREAADSTVTGFPVRGLRDERVVPSLDIANDQG